MDPIGTIRREEHGDGHTIWARIPPGYPDSELVDTEWTAIWSTAEGNLGQRLGDEVISQHPMIGVIPGTPAETGADVPVGAKVRTHPGVLYWTDKRVSGVVVEVPGMENAFVTHFLLQLDDDDHPTFGLQRRHFELIEDEG
jgi:hypothetical protein